MAQEGGGEDGAGGVVVVNPQKRKALEDVPQEDEEEEEEKICRFCFDGEEEEDDDGGGGGGGELISPCDCKGGQKYIHLSCLRQWQRMVLVSQPTHPDFWEDDIRHTKCNVCKADFTCPPPTRQELMLGFTGPEIAALIGEGCIIASHDSFNRTIQNQIADNPLLAHLTSVQHWLRGVYLITTVKEDNGEIEWTLEDSRDIHHLFKRLDFPTTSSVGSAPPPFVELADGSKYELQTSQGVLAGRTLEAMDEKHLKPLLESSLPCHLVFRPNTEAEEEPTTTTTTTTSTGTGGGHRRRRSRQHDCTDDKVRAVNLTRPFDPKGSLRVRAHKVIQETQTGSCVDVTYYRGGPCEEDRIVTCLVMGGRRRGYTVVQSFRTALLMAKRNAMNSQKAGRNNIAVGQQVTIQGLCKRQDLNGRKGFVQSYNVTEARFEVRLLLPEEEEEEEQQQKQQSEKEEKDNNDNNKSPNKKANDSNEQPTAATAPPVDATSTTSTTPGTSNSNQKQQTAQQQQQQQQVVAKVKPTNLQPSTGGGGVNKGKVLAFVGDARWTRVQLLGEIAKTSWGLCHAQIEDLLLPESTKLYDAVHPRLLYAPESEMSRDDEEDEETNRNDMIMLRRVVLNAQEDDDDDVDQDEEESVAAGGE